MKRHEGGHVGGYEGGHEGGYEGGHVGGYEGGHEAVFQSHPFRVPTLLAYTFTYA